MAAAVFGLLVLGQHLEPLQLAGIVAVCLANVLTVALQGRGSGSAA